MKIALIVPGGVDRSGTERVIPCILWLIGGLVEAGHDVHVFALHQEAGPARWRLRGAEVHNIGRHPPIPRTVAAVAAEHRRGRFDAIHSLWAQGCGTAGALAGLLLRVRHVLTLAGGDLSDIADIDYGGRRRWRGRAEAWFATRLAGHVTAPSLQLCREARALGIAARHVPLGVSLREWPPSAPRRRMSGAPLRLLHVASLNRVKDQDMLLRAAQLLVEQGLAFELVIIGADTLDGAIQRRAQALGLDEHVRFVGFVPHGRLREWVDRADLLVMTSRHEAGPLVTLEAAIAGVPTVGTSVGHIADFAPDAACAVPVQDWLALASAIRGLAVDEAMRLALAHAAQARALGCDVATTVAELCRLYAGSASELPPRQPAGEPGVARRQRVPGELFR